MVLRAHLFDPERAGWVGGAALRAVQAREQAEGRGSWCVLLGGLRAERDARAYGVRWDARIAPPIGSTSLAWRSVRRGMPGGGTPESAHAWSEASAGLAKRAWPGVRVVRESYLSRGAPVEPDLYGARDRASLGARWRLAPSTSIVGVLADADTSVACKDVSFLLGVLTLAGWPSAAVVWRGAAGSIERAERMIRAQGRRWRIVVEDEPLPRWIGGCDVGVALAGAGECPASIAWGVARGTPLVVERYGEEGAAAMPEGVRVVRAGVRHACAGAALDVLEHLPAREDRSETGVPAGAVLV